jgi:hypothetical protein
MSTEKYVGFNSLALVKVLVVFHGRRWIRPGVSGVVVQQQQERRMVLDLFFADSILGLPGLLNLSRKHHVFLGFVVHAVSHPTSPANISVPQHGDRRVEQVGGT